MLWAKDKSGSIRSSCRGRGVLPNPNGRIPRSASSAIRRLLQQRRRPSAGCSRQFKTWRCARTSHGPYDNETANHYGDFFSRRRGARPYHKRLVVRVTTVRPRSIAHGDDNMRGALRPARPVPRCDRSDFRARRNVGAVHLQRDRFVRAVDATPDPVRRTVRAHPAHSGLYAQDQSN